MPSSSCHLRSGRFHAPSRSESASFQLSVLRFNLDNPVSYFAYLELTRFIGNMDVKQNMGMAHTLFLACQQSDADLEASPVLRREGFLKQENKAGTKPGKGIGEPQRSNLYGRRQ